MSVDASRCSFEPSEREDRPSEGSSSERRSICCTVEDAAQRSHHSGLARMWRKKGLKVLTETFGRAAGTGVLQDRRWTGGCGSEDGWMDRTSGETKALV